MPINPDVFEKWKAAFLSVFPGFNGFGDSTGSVFDAEERSYKAQKSEALQKGLIRAGAGESSYFEAAVGSLWPAGQGSLVRPQNLNSFRTLDWKTFPEFERAVAALFSPDPINHPSAVQTFIDVFSKPLADSGVSGAAEQARQIATCLLMIAYPNAAIYSRRTVLDRMYLEGMGAKFPSSLSQSNQYTAELSFANEVRLALRQVGWKPRDLLDVQGFLWRTHEAIAKLKETPTSEMETPAMKKSQSTNLILYGPPGTGKTYETMATAVRLCDGGLPGDVSDPNYRKRIRQRYLDLKARNRIEFVTFHQSFSYEEFVEGLRPDTGSSESEQTSGGFRLLPQDGVFRRLARLAEQALRPRLAREPIIRSKAFKMSLGPTYDPALAYIFDECISGHYILLGYGGDIDWSDPIFAKRSAIKERWKSENPDSGGSDPNVVQMEAFRIRMSEGDLVIVSNGNTRFRAIGRIAGPYEFVKRERDEYNHRRKVEWLWVGEGEGLSHEDIYEKRFSQQTLYELYDSAIKWPALEEIARGGQEASEDTPGYVLIIDEINRANISKVFGELITLLEPDKRLGEDNELMVRLPYSKDAFGVPSNLHIVGTMNTADRSIALLDTALRRRFSFRELMPRAELLDSNIDGINLQAVLTALNDRIEYLFDRDHQIGHAFLMGCENREDVDAVFRDKIIPLLVEYFYEDWEKVRFVLGESRDDGKFISRRLLKVSQANGEFDDGGERWRYQVRSIFDPDAYAQLIS